MSYADNDDNLFCAAFMDQVSDWLSAQTGSRYQYIGATKDFRVQFSVTENWTLKTIDLEGNVTPPRRIAVGGYPRHWTFECYPSQLFNGSALELIRCGLTQDKATWLQWVDDEIKIIKKHVKKYGKWRKDP